MSHRKQFFYLLSVLGGLASLFFAWLILSGRNDWTLIVALLAGLWGAVSYGRDALPTAGLTRPALHTYERTTQ